MIDATASAAPPVALQHLIEESATIARITVVKQLAPCLFRAQVEKSFKSVAPLKVMDVSARGLQADKTYVAFKVSTAARSCADPVFPVSTRQKGGQVSEITIPAGVSLPDFLSRQRRPGGVLNLDEFEQALVILQEEC